MQEQTLFTKDDVIKFLSNTLSQHDINIISYVDWARNIDEVYMCRFEGEWTTYTRKNSRWYWVISGAFIGECFLKIEEEALQDFYDLILHYSNGAFTILRNYDAIKHRGK